MAGTVQLFATCLGDLFFPRRSTTQRPAPRGGVEVVVRQDRSAAASRFNSGHRRAARRVADARARLRPRAAGRRPSGSCATMLAHYLPELVDAQPYEIYELSAYLDAAAPPPAS